MTSPTPTPQAPLAAVEAKRIFDSTEAAALEEIRADKSRRKLKDPKPNRADQETARNRARGAVLGAQFAARLSAQDPDDPLTSDPVWNRKHPLYVRVNELIQAGRCEDEAVLQAQTEIATGVVTATVAPEPEGLGDLVDWLETQTWSEFAVDVAKYYRKTGRLSPKQTASAQSMRAKVEARQAARRPAPSVAVAADETVIDLSGLPDGRYGVPESDTRLKVKIEHGKSGSRWEGWTFVKDAAEYGAGQRYGTQRPGEAYQGKIRDALRTILADPKSAVAEYGRLTGHCGACGAKLEDPESVRLGIGPVCRTKGLFA